MSFIQFQNLSCLPQQSVSLQVPDEQTALRESYHIYCASSCFSPPLLHFSGILIRTWANAMGKNRLLSKPWNHLLFGMAGGYVGYNYKSWEASLLAKVNEKRVLRGMDPIDRQRMA